MTAAVLSCLGIGGDGVDRPLACSSAQEYADIRAQALSQVRGTVQADILKEDQAQNTCIFSTEFALRMMGDVQQYFSEQQVPQFLFSVSISGYQHRRSRRPTRSRSWPSHSRTASPSWSTTSRAA